MTKVTYRGVEYNAEEYNASVLAEASKRNRHDLMYRGIKYDTNDKKQQHSNKVQLTYRGVRQSKDLSVTAK